MFPSRRRRDFCCRDMMSWWSGSITKNSLWSSKLLLSSRGPPPALTPRFKCGLNVKTMLASFLHASVFGCKFHFTIWKNPISTDYLEIFYWLLLTTLLWMQLSSSLYKSNINPFFHLLLHHVMHLQQKPPPQNILTSIFAPILT